MELTKPRLVLKTADAANVMAVSQGHLKRQMDTKGGPLIGGEDYFLGQHKISQVLGMLIAAVKSFTGLECSVARSRHKNGRNN